MSILKLLLLLLIGAQMAFADPAWWTQPSTGIIQTGAAPNNHAVATVGQLKWVAYCAKIHLDNTLPGGAGSAINNLVGSFTPQSGVTYTREQKAEISQGNHSALSIGQLKAVAKVFYDRLSAAGYNTRANLIAYGYPNSWPINNPYPWDPATPVAQNYALATVGQLKLVFSFDPSLATTQAAAPVFSPDPNSLYTVPQQVALSSQTPGATIRYTLNGSTPNGASTVYTGPLSISSTTTIKAFASAPGYLDSAISTATYTIQVGSVSPPVFTPDADSYPGGTEVSMVTATDGATIYYTLNGTTPTTGSSVYSGPIPITSTTTVKAIASLNGVNSSVTSATYTITPGPPPPPTISPNGGSFVGSQLVTLGTVTAGADIYYDIGGKGGWIYYYGPFSIESSLTVKAVAVKNGVYSAPATATFIRTPDSVDNAIMNEIIGANVIGQNPVLIGAPGQTTSFTNGLANGLPIASGRLFSSGLATWQGANILESTSYLWGLPGDSVLTSIAYGSVVQTYDVSGISFQFNPTYSNVQITYAFASEEYLEYVENFDDAMLILVDGVPVNLTPDGKLVGVGSIHAAYPQNGVPALNGNLYTDNPAGSGNLNIIYDGVTVSLTANFTVTPNEWHNIRIVVGDADDHIYDSAAFIKLDSLTSTP